MPTDDMLSAGRQWTDEQNVPEDMVWKSMIDAASPPENAGDDHE